MSGKMAKTSVRFRPDSSEENLRVLREVQAKKKVDARRQEELNVLFDGVNAECASRSLAEKRKALASPDKPEKVSKAVHYGPLPGFVSGRWWGIRMDCSRDYIHEPFNESIHEGPFGAASICTSHLNTHNDVDLGDVLTFTSQEYRATDQSKDSLVLSYKNGVPIRLVRSYSLSNNYAPKTGYRYDGLYTVVDHWIGVSADSSKHHKFVLTRVLDQERAPWINKVSKSSSVLKSKRSISPRLTRSHSNIKPKEAKATKFIYNKVQKKSKVENVSAIVSRQVFKKFVPGSPDSSPRSASSTDSIGQNSCPNSCPSKLCNTNLSIRTNLYDSSHTVQDVKKTSSMTFCKMFKTSPKAQPLSQRQSQEEKMSTETSDAESTDNSSISISTANESTKNKIKKVTWADSYNSSSSIEKPASTTSNGFQYSGFGVIDGFSPTSSKKYGVLKYKNVTEHLFSVESCKTNSQLSNSTKDVQHVVEVNSKSNVSQISKASLSKVCEGLHETEILNESSSIESLAPDKLVSAIVKEKYHPMAKLLIGNMIGSENQETDIVNAYNTLTSKADQEDSKKSKENKLRNKFYIRNKSRKNGVLKKQRREIANLMIDAKFETVTRGSRYCNRLRTTKKRISKSEMSQRKLVNTRRIQSRNLNKDMRNTVRELQPKTLKKRKEEEVVIATKRPKTVNAWTQCTLLAPPSVNQSLQAGDSCVEITLSETDVKVEFVDIDDIKSEPCDIDSNSEEASLEVDTNHTRKSYFTPSAFATVNSLDSLRIDRLRSIGFRPIGTCSPTEDEDSRPDAEEEYNKYTSEETNVVGYMNEQLHFEDIEAETMDTTSRHEKSSQIEKEQSSHKKQLRRESSPRPVESLTEEDFDRPWHGWKKVSANGQTYWTGY